MDAFTEPGVDTVVVMSSAQVGKTATLGNVVGFFVDQDPSPILIIQPTLAMAEAYSKDRLAPMIRDTPNLRGKVKEARSRDSDNTILRKGFPGGHLTIVGANSPASLASRPIRIVLADEIDKYEITSQGDALDQAIKRTARFWNRKIGLFCTPTREGSSRIARAFQQGDQRKFFVPCPDCAHEQALVWAQVEWDKNEKGEHDPGTARYVCEKCGSWWDDAARWRAVSKGRWIALNPSVKNCRSFFVWEAYAPGSRLSTMVSTFLSVKDYPESLEVFVNTTLGETWKQRGDAPEYERLLERRENYPHQTVPQRACFLTAGIDVQQDRIEVQVVGWGEGKESWLIDYGILTGRTSEPDVWDALTKFLDHQYPHESGLDLAIVQWAIDSGFETSMVYAWARRQMSGRGIVIKGRDSGASILGKPSPVDVNIGGKTIPRGVNVWSVNVSALKYELYGWLRLPKPTEANQPYPPGYCHFNESQDTEFFKQLTAEEVHTRTIKGFVLSEWVKTRPRNEALDTRIYARAAAIRYGIDRATPAEWAKLRKQFPASADAVEGRPTILESAVAPKPEPALPASQSAPQPPQRRTIKSNWMNR